jgi:hypothetical protein
MEKRILLPSYVHIIAKAIFKKRNKGRGLT